MADERTPPAVPDLSPPTGLPEYAWLAGVIEGARGGDDLALQDAAASIQRLALGRADLELDGPRFSLLISDETFPGTRLDDETKRRFIGALESLVAAAGPGRPIESTIRCTEVHRENTVETLFGVQDGRLRPISRVRPVDADDRRRALRPMETLPELEGIGARRAIVITTLLLVLGGIAIWQSGLLSRLRSVDPTGLPVLMTEFGERLAVTVGRSLGNYEVEIRRGPTFPDTREKLEVWQDRIDDPRERIAHLALAGEGTVFVHLLGKDSQRIATAEVNVQPLIAGTETVVVATLPGSPATTGFAVSPVEGWGR